MFYKIANYFLNKRIAERRPIVRRFLNKDLDSSNDILIKINNGKDESINLVYMGNATRTEDAIKDITKKLRVEEQYVLLSDYFRNDPKRMYGINLNFSKYLEAVRYLYNTSNASIFAGVYTAPSENYHIIDSVQKSFSELIESLKLS